MRIVIPGEPIAKIRHRYVRRGDYVATYDPQEEVKTYVTNQILGQFAQAINSPIKEIAMEASNLSRSNAFQVDLYLGSSPPQKNQPERNLKLWGINPHSQKPDIDNFIKFYLDCSNKILFPDDKQIVALTAKKCYDSNPKVIITVEPYKKMKLPDLDKKIISQFSPEELQTFSAHCSSFVSAYSHDSDPEFNLHNIARHLQYLSEFSDKFKRIKKITEDYNV